MAKTFITKLIIGTVILSVCLCNHLLAQNPDSLRFPLQDRRGDKFSWDYNNPFDLNDTAIIKQDIEYDPLTNQYYITEKVGDIIYRKPTYLTFDEMYRLQSEKQEINYFNERSQTLLDLNRKVSRPPPHVYDKLFDRMFGVGPEGLKVDIKPQGTIDLTMGYQGQVIKNPTLPESARKNGGLDFNMNTNLNINASIGDKLKLPISYNTLANFDYENQLKLDYKGMDDEILKSVEAGNISFQTKGTLLSSPQSLFGVKTQLQFGKLFITAALASQKSQQQSLALTGGGLSQNINKKLDDYDENRHFLLAQYFKNNYNTAMSDLPVVNSQVQIMRMEVWVTNKTGATTNTRSIVGFMDLGENSPYNMAAIHSIPGNTKPQNYSNDLYSKLLSDNNFRNPSLVNSLLLARGLTPVNDYEKTFARKLDSSEYYYNPQVGFLSLNVQLQPDDVLAVAYQYTYNGQVFQVGEFSQDITVDSTQGVQKMLFLKLLKATSQRTNLPIWQLMMKNVYSIDVTGLQAEDFRLNVLYQEPSGGLKRYLPESDPAVAGSPLIQILRADRLNNHNDPQPDGLYDFVDGFTVIAQQGKIIFPVLQPFGNDLKALAFQGQPDTTIQKYVFQQLYDSIKAIAQTHANLNHYILQGTVKGSSNTDIYLGAFNIPQGSVTVTAGGQVLQENTDYIIDYNLGTLKIINQAIINSGIPVDVQFENNATYGIQQRSFLGLRLDYVANEHLSLGGTIERLAERPYFTKVNYGEDPIRNTMYGVDFNYQNQLPGLTRFINKLPFYNSDAPSSISAYGEAAALKPGHPPQIGKGSEGLIYIDDFEGATSSVDLRFPFISWALASTPQGNGLFPEATATDSLIYGINRAKLAWYNIEPTLQDKSSSNNPLKGNLKELSDPRVRQVFTNELFPQRTTNITDVITSTFDLAYYPTDRGPYNFTDDVADIDNTGKLKNPEKRWGGIMRSLDQTDFETGNIEYIEFWVQDPFIKDPTSTGGKLLIDLGNISEDILKDGRRFYENGLPTPTIPAITDKSVWGRTPINPIQVTQAFSNDPNDRAYQDVGFDGLDNDSEKIQRSLYLSDIASNFGAASPFYQQASVDPSNDDYKWYRDASYDESGTGILGRYKNYNNPQGNSPVSTGNSQFSPAATLYPDNEDLNHDNTLNESEEYYEYEIDLKPGMAVGKDSFITDQRLVNPRLADGTTAPENWYLFRVPIEDFKNRIGQIPDFKSIRFMRMYLTGFQDSVVLRFATLDLVRNQWRTFTYDVDTVGAYKPVSSNSTINVLAVNVEENSSRQPIPYKTPPGIDRVQELSNNGVNLLQNEQAMSLQINNLEKHQSRAVFKTLNLDLRQYGEMNMFVHAESGLKQSPQLANGQIDAVVRIGQDFLSNYYEVKIPLEITQFNSAATAEQIWPDSNNLNLILNDLVQLKIRRDSKTANIAGYYSEIIGNRTYAIKGNPNLGEVQGFLISVENETENIISTEVWVNELRLSKIDDKGGYAALGRIDMQLADLGTLSLSANTYSYGFGSIDQQINQRAIDNMFQYDAALNIDAGKLLPQKIGISIPVYASINKTILTPEYDPYDLDILYKDKLKLAGSGRDSIKKAAADITTIKTLNFTNVRFGQANAKPHLWSISNFDLSYSYTEFDETNPLILENKIKKYHGGLGYTYNQSSKFKEPFKNLIKNKSTWLTPIKDINFNYIPSLLSFRADINRQYGIYVPRIVNTYDSKVEQVDTTYDKYFTFDRYYNLRWDFTRSLNLDFSAVAFARVDEPYGQLNTKAKKDIVRENFFHAGRNTMYQQQATLSYNIPLAKFPVTDWITARYSYTTSYNWIGASLLATSLGNIIENTQQNNFTGEFDFTRLYSKSKFLNKISQTEDNTDNGGDETNPSDSIQAPKPRAQVVKDSSGIKLKGFEKRHALQKWRQQKRDYRKQQRKNKQAASGSGLANAAGHIVTMIKHASLSYNENYDSRVPGITTGTGYLGQNQQTNQPGFAYIFGKQPDSNWLNQKAREGVITRDSLFNILYTQDYQQQINLTAQLEPIREFNIDVNVQKTFSKNYSELFKNLSASPLIDSFKHLSPLAGGGFSVSYISFQTLFKKSDPNQISQTFQEFQNNRIKIANRLANANPYWDKKFQVDGFPTGYGRYQQDVLLPAFIAAYTGKDPNSVALINQSNSSIKSNPFSGIHALPNWRVTYTGLTRIASLADKFSNITITHGYNSTFSMNSFTSALLYYDPLHLGQPAFLDTVSGNYIPFFLIPNLTIQEQFAPLIGFDITTTDQTAIRFEYAKSRQLSLSLYDYQLSEVRSSSVTFGGTYRKKGATMPFKLPFIKANPDQTDLNISLDLSFRNDLQTNSRLDQPTAYSTGGQKTISIQPSLDYLINNRIDLKFYFDQQRIIPYISTSAPIITTRAGIELRISIAPSGPGQ